MQKGDKYKRISDGAVVTFDFATSRAVRYIDEHGAVKAMRRRDFEQQYQEVKPRGRKAASSK